MVTARGRPGHSLPELIVAVTFLGASLGAVGALAALAAGWTGGAVVRQEGVRQASAVLDSLLSAPRVTEGERRLPGLAVRWTVLASGAGVDLEVTATGPGGRELVRLGAPWFPPTPVLPWPAETEP